MTRGPVVPMTRSGYCAFPTSPESHNRCATATGVQRLVDCTCDCHRMQT